MAYYTLLNNLRDSHTKLNLSRPGLASEVHETSLWAEDAVSGRRVAHSSTIQRDADPSLTSDRLRKTAVVYTLVRVMAGMVNPNTRPPHGNSTYSLREIDHGDLIHAE